MFDAGKTVLFQKRANRPKKILELWPLGRRAGDLLPVGFGPRRFVELSVLDSKSLRVETDTRVSIDHHRTYHPFYSVVHNRESGTGKFLVVCWRLAELDFGQF